MMMIGSNTYIHRNNVVYEYTSTTQKEIPNWTLIMYTCEHTRVAVRH